MITNSENHRPRLSAASAEVRGAVRAALPVSGLVLVGLSGGPDSLALASATAFEARKAGIDAGVVIVNHGLQKGSAEVAEKAAAQARALGLAPVVIRKVTVDENASQGLEAAARDARYAAFESAAAELGASHILLAHTMDDQAETVLLGLARGSGPKSIAGMREERISVGGTGGQSARYLRPLLGIRKATLLQMCVDEGLEPWHDPHNTDPKFLRVKIRTEVIPYLEENLSPGIIEALARTAAIIDEDATALEEQIEEQIEDIVEIAEAGISISVPWLRANPVAIRHRTIRMVVQAEFGVSISRERTLAVAALIDSSGEQKRVELPGVVATRRKDKLIFQASN
ncbi:MAG: tRNA lysidine(34) synthetase TilS [Microbacteriaceae bacterium]|nr:tRNA lysidine(34) synthetase TilS [Microbacteriaceae bacterium]